MRLRFSALPRVSRWARRPARTRPRQPERQATRKYRTLLAPVEQAGGYDGAQTPAMPWAALRAVVRAHDHRTHGGQLLTALVTAPADPAQATEPQVVATMVVVGLHPDDCLGIGDTFTLWRGADIARGVITQRLFV